MRGRQGVVAGQADAIIAGVARKSDQFIGDRASDPAASMARGDEHAGHLAFSIIEMPDRAGADDRLIGGRTQENRPIAIGGFRIVDVREARIDEIPHKGIRVLMKMLVPDRFDEPSRRLAESAELSNPVEGAQSSPRLSGPLNNFPVAYSAPRWRSR
jgi:hypothetical protein